MQWLQSWSQSDPYTCIYWRVQMDLNLHTQNIRLKVRCLSTRLREPHTHTHSHTYNKSQGILSKRSAEPGQTEGDGQAQGQSQWGSFRHSSSHPFTVIQPLPWLRSQEVFVAHISELLVGHYSPLMPRPIVLQNICWSLSNIVDVIMAVAAEYDHISLRGWWR